MRWGLNNSRCLGRLAHVQDFAISLAKLPPASLLRYRDFSPRTFRQLAANFRRLVRIRKLTESYQDLAEFTESGDFSIYRHDRWSYYGRCLQMVPPFMPPDAARLYNRVACDRPRRTGTRLPHSTASYTRDKEALRNLRTDSAPASRTASLLRFQNFQTLMSTS